MLQVIKVLALGLIATGILAGQSGAQEGSSIATALPAPSASDRANLPPGATQLMWGTEQKIIGHRNMNVIFPSHKVAAGAKAFPLPRDPDIAVAYQVDGVTYSVSDYFARSKASGLLVIKNGRIVFERYGNGYNDQHAGTSRSMAKSMTSIMVGLAMKDGYIKSLDAPVAQYVPELKGSMYGNISLRLVLQMLSGVPFTENAADPTTDIYPLLGCVHKNQKNCLISFLKEVSTRPGAVPKAPGSTFFYSSADSVLMGIVVERATKMASSAYLSQRVWQPFGMERDGYWNVESVDGNTYGGSGFGATLRDYGRLGLYLLRDGVLPDGRKTLPDGWMAEATKPTKPSIDAKSPYGYYWWLPDFPASQMHGTEGTYFARGSNGQKLMVNPSENVVIAKWGPENSSEDTPMFAAIVNKLH